jgi:Ca2+/Na+ antiporter
MIALPFSDNIVAVSSILVALTVLMYYLSRFTEIKGNVGYAYTVYPWITTFPETLVSTITAVFGYPITAIWNSVFSATFDVAVVFGVSGIGKRVVFRPVKLVIPTVVGGLIFASLAVDFSVSVFDGFILYMYLIAVSAIAIAVYGFRIDRKENLVKHILGLFAIAIAAVVFSFYVMALANLINQKIAGVVAACLTSIPDLIIAAVYGISDISQAEVLGCVTHDFAENMATAAIVAGIFGKEIVDANPLLTSMVVAMTMVVLIATTIDGDIDVYDALLLIGSFFVLAFFAIMM